VGIRRGNLPQEKAKPAHREADADEAQASTNPRQERSLCGEKVFGILLYWLFHVGIVMKTR
jgi:hypothetical protein